MAATMKTWTSALLIAAASTVAASAQVGEGQRADPIDKALNECLAKLESQTTSGMVNCTASAYEAYVEELETVYDRVMAKLDPRSKALVHAAQREWLAFRKTEHAAMNGPWTHDRGSLVSLDIAAADIDAVKERIRELRLYE